MLEGLGGWARRTVRKYAGRAEGAQRPALVVVMRQVTHPKTGTVFTRPYMINPERMKPGDKVVKGAQARKLIAEGRVKVPALGPTTARRVGGPLAEPGLGNRDQTFRAPVDEALKKQLVRGERAVAHKERFARRAVDPEFAGKYEADKKIRREKNVARKQIVAAVKKNGNIPPELLKKLGVEKVEDDKALAKKLVALHDEKQAAKPVLAPGQQAHFPGMGATPVQGVSPERVAREQVLRESKVIESKENPEGGVMGSWRLKIQKPDGTEAKANFKPISGEQNFRRNIKAGTLYKREIVAARVADLFGVECGAVVEADVPPPPGHSASKGALHEWVQGHRYDKVGESVLGSIRENNTDHDAVHMFDAFDMVIGNTDRHGGNVLLQEGPRGWRPAALDHGLSFPNGSPEAMRGSPTMDVLVGEPGRGVGREMSDGVKDRIKAIRPEALIGEMKQHLSKEPRAIRAAVKRLLAVQKDPSVVIRRGPVDRGDRYGDRMQQFADNVEMRQAIPEHLEAMIGA